MTSLNETSSVMTFEPPSPSQRAGGIVVAVFALLSTLALAFIAFRTIRIAITVFLQRDDSTSRPSETLLFRTQLGHYVGCLMLSNMFISFAGLINFNWTSPSGLSQGSACSAQAALMTIGIWGTCWFTVALGVNNLNSFVFRIHQTRWHTLAVVTVGWIIASIAGLVPLQKFGLTGSSCGITRSYPTDIFAVEALPIILATIVSIAVYSVIFIILRRDPSTQKLGGSKSTNERREDGPEEHHTFIRTIIWTMSWFPFASVLLLLPFCTVHIIMSTGHSIPFASSAFVDVCVSMLGFVNAGLLWIAHRAVSPVYRSRSENDAAADETFGNDASYESPITPQGKFISPPPPIFPHENGHRMRNATQGPSNHSRDSSWASVDSNTELLGAEKASARAKVAPLPLRGSTESLWLSRQPSDPRLRAASSSPHPPRAPSVTGDVQGQQCSAQPMADTGPPRKVARELTFKSKAPPALNLSYPPVSPHLRSAWDIANKSAILAVRLGIPATSACTPSRTAGVDQGNAGVSAPSIPRIEVNPWTPDNADQPNSQPSPSSLDSDCDSDDMGEIMHVKPLPQLPVPSDNDEVVVEPFNASSSQWMQARSQRATMVSVWSQESSRYTMSRSLDEEAQEAFQQLMGNLVKGDQASVGKMAKRQTPLGPRARPETSFKTPTKFSSQRLTESPADEQSAIVITPNDSIV